ncbi:hypothetical protein ACJ73_08882 [Blastomyces percursus]|uniref:F-box domain-containing protein n=1 Tax=Blastomyces percursus TaxID=1658174 RepID=A0A1J9PJ30_9EURO|nr:hypothetical protein ACJ73_08882 [Blastomyces percursus]
MSEIGPLEQPAEPVDPFKRLNIECMSFVLKYLTPGEVCRLKQVNRSWKQYISSWIFEHGWLYHWPRLTKELAPLDEQPRAKRYLELAKMIHNFTRGEATLLQHYQGTRLLTPAGIYVAWFEGDGVYWQLLGDTVSPRHKLPLPSRLVWMDITIAINAAGGFCVHVDSPSHPVTFVASLKNGKAWQRSTNEVPYMIGQNKVYVYKPEPPTLGAYSLEAGTPVYMKLSTEDDIKLFKDSNSMIEVIQPDGTERVISLVAGDPSNDSQHKSYRVAVVNGLDGEIVQNFYQDWSQNSLLSPASNGGFSFIGQPSLLSSIRVIETFSQQGGGFAKEQTEAIALEDSACARILVEPSTLIVIGYDEETLYSFPLEECSGSQVHEEVTRKVPITIDRCFRAICQKPIRLESLDGNIDGVEFVGGGRFLVKATIDEPYDTTCIFQF